MKIEKDLQVWREYEYQDNGRIDVTYTNRTNWR